MNSDRSKMKRAFAWVKNPKPMALRFKPASGDRPCEIYIDGMIGESLWDDRMTGSREYDEALAAIPEEQPFCVYVNSEGGSVKDGLGIYASTRRRRANATFVITGYALSISSYFPLAAGKLVVPDSSIWMIHEPWSYTMGDEEDHMEAAKMLSVHARTLADGYAADLGRSADEMRGVMKAETWMTGKEARDFGIGCPPDTEDTMPDDEAEMRELDPSGCRRFPTWLSKEGSVRASGKFFSFPRPRLADVAASKQPPTPSAFGAEPNKDEMKRETIIALLTKHGVKVDAQATDENLANALEGVLNKKPEPENRVAKLEEPGADLSRQVSALQAQLDGMRKMRELDEAKIVENEIDACINERRIPASDREKWLTAAKADRGVIAAIKSLDPRPAPADPVLEVVNADPKDCLKGIDNRQSPVLNLVRGGDFVQASKLAREASRIYQSNAKRIKGDVFAANTVSTDLKRVLIMNEILRDYKRNILSAQAFSTVFSDVPLQGTDEVVVPYYANFTTASTDFVSGTGYTTASNTSDSSKKITVNKRKYQMFNYESATLARQPFFNVAQHLALYAEQLGVDVIADVLSVVTAANFSTAVITEDYSAFDSNDFATMRAAANKADWPVAGRSVILDSDYEGNLFKDDAVKLAANNGTDMALKEGSCGRLSGFDIYQNPRLPANDAGKFKGAMLFKSAILLATAPVAPAPAVRNLLSAYSLVVDPDTGIGFNYRQFGNAVTDVSNEVIEAAYGYAVGVPSALQRIMAP